MLASGFKSGKSGISRYWLLLTVLTSFQVVDGFDLVALSLSASSIRHEWTVTSSMMGALLSAAQLGSVISAASVGRVSDNFGIRKILLASNSLMVAGSLLAVASHNNTLLLVARIVTGIGLGGAIPLTVGYIVNEVEPATRPVAISVALAGLPVGQMMAGTFAQSIIRAAGWRGLFWVATAAGISLLPAIAFLISAKSEEARPAQPNNTPLPRSHAGESRILTLWRTGYRLPMMVLLTTAFSGALIIHSLTNWMPLLLEHGGLNLRQASISVTMLAGGGLVGNFVWGPLMARVSPYQVIGLGFFTGGVLLAIVSLPFAPVAWALFACPVIGFFITGCYFAISVFVPLVFPPYASVHVMGLLSIMTRTGGLLGPLIVGLILANRTSERTLFLLASGLAILSAILMLVAGAYRTRDVRG